MKLLGLQSWASHDPAVCVLSDETDSHYLEFATIAEERLLRSKSSYQFPFHAFIECMDRVGIESLREIDWLVTDYAKIPRWINSGPHYRKLLHDYIKLRLDFPVDRILIIRHHDSHAANAYYPSGFDDAAILVVDGVGSENETISLYRGEGNRIEFIERSYDYGLGVIYDAVTKLLGLVGNHGVPQPGKLMGLAPYGADKPGPILDIRGKYDGLRVDYSHFVSRLPFYRIKQSLVPCTNKTDVTNPYYSRIAYDIQEEIENAMTHLARYALKKTGSRNLVISGGVGLNCVANGKLLDALPVDGFYVYPACSDEGFELGAVLYAYYNRLSVARPKKFHMPTAYVGRTYDQKAIAELLKRLGILFNEVSLASVARKLSSGQIVGWFIGGSEAGPRALGHRSILADPRDPAMKDKLNHRVKHREAFRPFAPSVLEEYASEFFDLDRSSPYMLLARPVKEAKKAIIPSVVHVDGTSRIQTVSREYGGAYYEVIDEFRKITGVPMVLNTSFNDNNEPIVETPEDALITFLSTEIDALYLEGLLVSKEDLSSESCSRIRSLLRSEREERQKNSFRAFIRRCCKDWKWWEIPHYHSHELVKALWHRNHEAIEHIEKAVEAAVSGQKSVYFVGTQDHTEMLYKSIPGFRELNVTGVAYLSKFDWNAVDFKKFDSIEMSQNKPDVVLITSYEFQEEATRLAQTLFDSDIEIIRFYKTWSEDPKFVIEADSKEVETEDGYPGVQIFFGSPSHLGFQGFIDV